MVLLVGLMHEIRACVGPLPRTCTSLALSNTFPPKTIDLRPLPLLRIPHIPACKFTRHQTTISLLFISSAKAYNTTQPKTPDCTPPQRFPALSSARTTLYRCRIPIPQHARPLRTKPYHPTTSTPTLLFSTDFRAGTQGKYGHNSFLDCSSNKRH